MGSSRRDAPAVPVMRPRHIAWGRVGRRVIGAAGLVAITVGVLGVGAGADEDVCAKLTTFSAVGSAAGVRTLMSAPGYSIVTEVSSNLPGAQAMVDSILGSKGWAGAPYVPQAAENAGQARQDPNNVPVFATTDYPATPEASNSTPTATVSAKSAERSSTAKAEGGGPGSDQAAAGHAVATADASCAADGTLTGSSDNRADMTNFGGVLGIGSVKSYAVAVRAANGDIQKLEGTMQVEGVTVLGQAAAITDKGLVLGTSASPLPDNPLTSALESAGITVRYIAADKDEKTGEVTAPGLEVTVVQQAAAGGGGPVTNTYTFGRAYALAGVTPGDAPAPSDEGTSDGSTGSFTDTPSVGVLSSPSPVSSGRAGTPIAKPRGANVVATPMVQIGSWSVAPAYSALGVGALLLVAWFLLEKIAVRFRWR